MSNVDLIDLTAMIGAEPFPNQSARGQFCC
jgi:hypothetical protein